MADLTANVEGIEHQGAGPTMINFPCDAADTFYKGALCFLDATSGKLVTDGIANGDRFVGICPKEQTTTAADQEVSVAIDGVWTIQNSNVGIAEAGDLMYHDNSADSNNPADLDTYTGLTQEAGVDEAVGTLLWCDGTQAKIDFGQRVLPTLIPA